jgi:multiple sugar transport system substrate-binding protein
MPALLLMLAVAAAGCGGREEAGRREGRVVLTYWEKWTGFEAGAMDAVLADFHAAQTNIFVERLSVSDIARKLMLATAGGNPPDVAGIWAQNVYVYAEKGGLTPLDAFLSEAGITGADYHPAVFELCRHRGFTWALPSTPATLALHWNRRLFRDAGLDPDQPPRSIAELDAMAEQLTIVEVLREGQPVRVRFPELTPAEREARAFTLVQLGYTPTEPGWYNAMWPAWFGGRLWDGDRAITAVTPENVAALTWFRSYAETYGLKNLQAFGSSFGNFSSPQSPFLAGKVAMTLQGVWMYNFISKYAPALEWGAAAFPSVNPEALPDVTLVECDMLVIPKGARHAREAFEFIRYVNTRGAMEKLCLGQRKFSPLREVSADFYRDHPNPFIRVFADLVRSPNARTAPRITVWSEYDEELRIAYERAFTGVLPPAAALEEAQKRVQWKYDRVLRRWDLVQEARLAEWAEYAGAARP